MNKKNRLARILIPVLIVVIIATMWFIKNRPENGEEPAAEPTVDPLSGADFQLDANGQIDYEALFRYGLPIIVDYGADTCIPCKEMAPVLELLNEEMQGKAFIKFVNVWKYQNSAANVPVQLIPSQVIFCADGTPYTPSDEVLEKISGFKKYSDKNTGTHAFTVHEGGLTEEQMRLILADLGVA